MRDAGLEVILDHHALPGVSTANQMFAGRYVTSASDRATSSDNSSSRCTSDVQFYASPILL